MVTALCSEVMVCACRAGESRSEARGNISFGGPIGSENTSGGGGGGGGGAGGKYEFLYIRSICTFKLHTTV